MTKAMLIINPVAGKEKAEEIVPIFEQELLKMYDQVEKVRTEKKGDAQHFAKKACEANFEAVFTIGGDGTVNECVNGLAGEPNRPLFGFLPGGTVNTTARELKIPLDLKEAAASFSKMKSVQVDVGKANERYFLSSISMGEFPSAAQKVSDEEKEEHGILAFLGKEFKALREQESTGYRLWIDGEPKTLHSPLVILSLGHVLAGMENILPDATLTDGKLSLLALKTDSIIDNLAVATKAAGGNIQKDERVLSRKCTQIRIESEKKIQTNVDGDEGPFLPLDIVCLPGHLTVFAGPTYIEETQTGSIE